MVRFYIGGYLIFGLNDLSGFGEHPSDVFVDPANHVLLLILFHMIIIFYYYPSPSSNLVLLVFFFSPN